MNLPNSPRRDDDATERIETWAAERRADGSAAALRDMVRRLGAHVVGDRVEIGFWTPELERVGVRPGTLALEVLTPVDALRWDAEGPAPVRVDRIDARAVDGWVWLSVAGLVVGTRASFGSLYWLRYETSDGAVHRIRDPLAHSLPYGAYAPAEVYDVAGLQEDRADAAFFRSHGAVGDDPDPPRFGPPANVLQVHVGTATPSGSLAELAELYRDLARKVTAGARLTPAERNWVEYDAVQLLPVEPVIEYGGGGAFFRAEAVDAAPSGATVDVTLRRPDVTNWGYDIVIAGSAAVNPALLRTGRPDELRDLAEALHTFPGGGIRLILDVVFGHADNQGQALLPAEFFSGPNMYGQDMNFRHPVVREIMLEMQRRKVDFGADGVRVDGAQDFKVWDPETDTVRHDDEYLESMSALVQQVAGVSYRPFMIFEDGRPWPREDWETASTYRAVIDRQPHAFQWGPLTFAHNTPCLAGFWNAKWWRIEEIAAHGENWINGCANHDTLRRGYQISTDRELNRRLGSTLPEILRTSYDHPAATLLAYGIFPGAPMEFVAATMRSPWAFIRNTDDVYGPKIAAEEAGFLVWRADPKRFGRPDSFPRMKARGFGDLAGLAAFLEALQATVADEPYDLDRIAEALRERGFATAGPRSEAPLDAAELRAFARDFMDDLHAYCHVSRWTDEVDEAQSAFNRRARAFRRARRWLGASFGPGDRLDRRVGTDGSTRVVGVRTAPDGSEQVMLLANLEGAPWRTSPAEAGAAGAADGPGAGWMVAVAAPGLEWAPGDVLDSDASLNFEDAQGMLLVRAPEAAPGGVKGP